MRRLVIIVLLALAACAGRTGEIDTVGGGQVALGRDRALLAFVDGGLGSRSQLSVLKSMHMQYGSRVTVVVVPDMGVDPVNLYHDWNLGGISVATEDAGLAARYAVTARPTTLLISDGAVRERFEGVTPAQRLAFALQELPESQELQEKRSM